MQKGERGALSFVHSITNYQSLVMIRIFLTLTSIAFLSSLQNESEHGENTLKTHKNGKLRRILQHQMTIPTSQRHQLGLRSIITWFLLIITGIYILYTSKLFLTHDRQCTTPVVRLSAQEDMGTLWPNLTNLTSDETDLQQEGSLQMVPQRSQRYDTDVKHIFFGIAASSTLWDERKEYIKLWWQPKETRGVVWLDNAVKTRRNEGLPDLKLSGNTSRFKYTNRQGKRSALRISRVISENLRLGVKDVRWFVMGDDDTVFIVDNLVRILSKYDHRQFYYIGSSSESHVQNIFFSYAMAYGGGGFAISYPLAKELEKMQDRCIQRYPGLYGSDDRIQACMAELGVPLTREAGFHQYDVYGNLLGLLGAHPVAPLLSLHHLDVVDPIFPDSNRVRSLRRLFEAVKIDSASIMQQSICYDKARKWSISVSWGYVVQILRGVTSPRELEMPSRTFLNWYKRADYTAYAFNTRPVTKHPCQKPYIYYMKTTRYDRAKKQTVGIYSRYRSNHPYCRWKMESPDKIDSVVVLKTPDSLRWQKSPRRDCCRVLPTKRRSAMYIWVGKCHEGEFSGL